MNTRIRSTSLLAAALGALLVTSGAAAGVAEKVEGSLRGQTARLKESRQHDPGKSESRRSDGRGSGGHQAPRESAPRERTVARNDNRQDRNPREWQRDVPRGGQKPAPAPRGDATPRKDPVPRGGGYNRPPGHVDGKIGKPDVPAGGNAWSNRGNDHRNNDRNRNDSRSAWNGNRFEDRARYDAHRSQTLHRAASRIVTTLPPGHRHYTWNGAAYYHHGGHWYRPYGTRYVVVGAPYGLYVSYLPSYYTSFWFGGVRYFHADSTYYLYEPVRRGYVVTHSPYDDERDEEDSGSPDEDLYVYPAQGQSEQQQADDRYECHRWAAQETGYDPIESDYDADQRAGYLRALTACLTGRGYSVK